MAHTSTLEKPALTDSLAHRLIAEHWQNEAGILAVEGHPIIALIAQFGSPLYVYSAAIMRRRVALLRQTLGPNVDVFFSVKANPNPAVLKVFGAAGAGLEIASAAEYVRARRTDVDPHRILFAGPGKTFDELAYVIAQGIGEIHVESFDEIDRLIDIAADQSAAIPVSIRVNPDASVQGGAMRMGGGATAFGFDEALIAAAIARISAAPGLTLKGLHLFSGTQILNAETLLSQWNYGATLARRLIQNGAKLQTLDLGGGLGIPYFSNDKALDLAQVAQGAAELTDMMRTDPHLRHVKLMVEPGRFLVGPAGLYATRITNLKTSHDELFAVTDGGMHHHLAATGNLGQIIKKDYPVVLANRLNAPHDTAQKVVGPLCTPLDTYGRKTILPKPALGDCVAILQSGAYGLSSSPVGFLSHPMPAEILIDGDRIDLIRPRGTFEQPITPMP